MYSISIHCLYLLLVGARQCLSLHLAYLFLINHIYIFFQSYDHIFTELDILYLTSLTLL